MTLLITVANSREVHQSSDYRLTDAGRPVETANGAKQLGVSGRDWSGQISFTGIARDGNGYNTREWLRESLVAAGAHSTLEEVVRSLSEKAERALATVHSYDRRLSIVVGAVSHGMCRVFLLSNWEGLTSAPAVQARPTVDVLEVDLGRPRVLVNGFAGALPAWARRRLYRLVSQCVPPQALRDAMAWANRTAATNAVPFVSEECWVQSLMANGHSAGKNYGAVAGTPSNIHLGSTDWGRMIAAEFPAAPGKQLTLLQSAGFSGQATPAPTQIGEPRSIKVSSPTNTLSLAASGGHAPFARVTVAGIQGDLIVRKNAWSTTVLAVVTLEIESDPAKWPKPFRRKRLPLRCVPIVDGGSPRTWDYSLDIRWDQQALEVDIAQMSVALRSQNLPSPMLALGITEELVMAAPSQTLSMVVTVNEPRSVVSLEARFLLREFPELLVVPSE